MAIERVLVVGATGNIGVSAIIAALRTGREVLAVVRNNESAEKLFKHVGTREGIITVDADVTAMHGVQKVVEQVKAGHLPSFQHVYATVGIWDATPMHELSNVAFRTLMRTGCEANFFAYRATIPYLLEQNNPHSTFTICVGAADVAGWAGATGMTQGALVGFINAAIFENQKTNIRVNEMYLVVRVAFDTVAEKDGSIKASRYAKSYQDILESPEIRGQRVIVSKDEDLDEPRLQKKLMSWEELIA